MSEFIRLVALPAGMVLIAVAASGGNGAAQVAAAAPTTESGAPPLPLDTPVAAANEPVPEETGFRRG